MDSVTPIKVPTHKGSSYYSNKFRKNGYLIILNIENFITQPHREGSWRDIGRLKNTFSKLHFDYAVKTDLTQQELIHYIIEMAEKDYTDYSCLFIMLLTHGIDKDFFMCSDEKFITTMDLTILFEPDYCTSLAGKPKFVLIQACRAGGIDVVDTVLKNISKHLMLQRLSVSTRENISAFQTRVKSWCSMQQAQGVMLKEIR